MSGKYNRYLRLINIQLAILIIISVFPLLSLLTPGLPVTHDGQDHVARIANFYQSLREGTLIPRWAGNLNWGFGHPILMFLYPLPSYAASFFHSFGFSLINSTKLVFATSYILSTVFMFAWARKEFGNKGGFVASIIYGFSPYRFVDLYVRGALGEHVAFVFIPLVFLGLWGLCAENRFSFWGSILAIGITGLLLSHNAVSVMIFPIVCLYVLYLTALTKGNKVFFLINVFVYGFLGFCLAAFFWIPAFFEGKYTLRDVVTQGEAIQRMVPFTQFIFSPWKYAGGGEFTKELGVIQWGVVLTSIILTFSKKVKKADKILLIAFLTVFFMSLFIMTHFSTSIWKMVSILQKFQFPWRFLTVSVFAVSAMGGLVIKIVQKYISSKIIYALLTVVVLSTIHMWKPKEYKNYSENYFTSIYSGTTDTGESAPIWSVRFMERKATRLSDVIIGEAVFVDKEKTSTIHKYSVQATQKTRIVENTLYFPGWNVYVDSKKIIPEFQDSSYRGLMTFWIDEGVHEVLVKFENTKLRTFAEATTAMSLILLVLIASNLIDISRIYNKIFL